MACPSNQDLDHILGLVAERIFPKLDRARDHDSNSATTVIDDTVQILARNDIIIQPDHPIVETI